MNNGSQSYFGEDEELGFLSVIIDHELLIAKFEFDAFEFDRNSLKLIFEFLKVFKR